ncbi:MAG: FG-GAP repeat domain-containing protein [Limisphaerales bacterium]
MVASAKDYYLHSFKKIQLTDQFWGEGANFGDFNRDGIMDVVSGPFWYEGPDFKKRHEYYPATEKFKLKKEDGTEVEIPGFEGALGVNNAYSRNFLAFTYDFNNDGWTDILILGFPGAESFWYENPQGKPGHWKRHLALDVTDNESPTFADLTGDGKPEIICSSKGYLGYAAPDWKNPTAPWKWHSISPNNKYHKFTHGLGIGDVNGDGRMDILERDGWWEQPASLQGDPVWTNHKYPFAPGMGGAQMYVYDVNGDGLNDVITGFAAHAYGLSWHEQLKDKQDGQISFREHIILDKQGKRDKYGVTFSQLHAIDLVDINGDGLKDIVTGKRFWAHGPKGDPEPNAPAVLYWFQLVRNKNKTAEFVPHLIDDNSGVGTQVVAKDFNGDKLPDIVVGNKRGTFVHVHERKKVSKKVWEAAQPKPIQEKATAGK